MLISTAAVCVPVAIAAGSDALWRFGVAGTAPGLLGPHPAGIAVDADGTVYVADASDGRIEVFAHGGAPAGGWGGLDAPTALAFGDGGRLLVADAAGVRAFTPAGDTLAAVSDATGITGIAESEGGPTLLADADDGVLRAVDADGERVLAPLAGVTGVAVTATGEVLATAGDRVHRFSLDGAPGGSWSAPGARAVAVAPDGSVLVATGTRHTVDVYSAQGEQTGSLSGDLNVVQGVAADCRGNVYAADNSDPRGHVFGDPALPAPPCLVPTPTPTPSPSPTPTPEPTPEPVQEVLGVIAEAAPVLGRSTRATALEGTVYVGKSRRKLTGRAIFPVGTEIDTSEGVVKLEFETAPGADRGKYGRFMSGEFSDGAFTIHQGSADSLVELVLDGSGAVGAANGRAVTSAKKRRRVWSTAKGRFRTTGSHGAATVRSTRWLTEERERGTYFRVREGEVAVKDFATGKTHILGPGDEHLSKRPCLSQRRFRIRLRAPAGTTVRSAVVLVRGKRVPVRRGSRLSAVVDLRGVGKQTVRVRISVQLASGQTLTGTRVYRTCRPERLPGGAPPEL